MDFYRSLNQLGCFDSNIPLPLFLDEMSPVEPANASAENGAHPVVLGSPHVCSENQAVVNRTQNSQLLNSKVYQYNNNGLDRISQGERFSHVNNINTHQHGENFTVQDFNYHSYLVNQYYTELCGTIVPQGPTGIRISNPIHAPSLLTARPHATFSERGKYNGPQIAYSNHFTGDQTSLISDRLHGQLGFDIHHYSTILPTTSDKITAQNVNLPKSDKGVKRSNGGGKRGKAPAISSKALESSGFAGCLNIQEGTSSHSAISEKQKDIQENNGCIQDSSEQNAKIKRRKTSNANNDAKPCNCQRSQCSKLYCVCFASGKYCTKNCQCKGCFNLIRNEDQLKVIRNNITDRNQNAIAPKICEFKKDETQSRPSSARHLIGSSCKKSTSKNNYCESYQSNVVCPAGCRCKGCQDMSSKKIQYSMLEDLGNNKVHRKELEAIPEAVFNKNVGNDNGTTCSGMGHIALYSDTRKCNPNPLPGPSMIKASSTSPKNSYDSDIQFYPTDNSQMVSNLLSPPIGRHQYDNGLSDNLEDEYYAIFDKNLILVGVEKM